MKRDARAPELALRIYRCPGRRPNVAVRLSPARHAVALNNTPGARLRSRLNG